MAKRVKKPASAPRIDRKHRFPIRIDELVHNEVDALAFKHNLSLNVLYCEAVAWAAKQNAFGSHLQDKFPRDTRRGHFVFLANETTQRIGKH